MIFIGSLDLFKVCILLLLNIVKTFIAVVDVTGIVVAMTWTFSFNLLNFTTLDVIMLSIK